MTFFDWSKHPFNPTACRYGMPPKPSRKFAYEAWKEWKRERQRRYRLAHPDRVRATARRHAHRNRDRICAAKRAKGLTPEQRALKVQRESKRVQTDPMYALTKSIRARLRVALRTRGSRKTSKTLDLTGCSKEALFAHIESQFTPGMSWENRGLWHIDHIKPLASFDLSDESQLRQACHYTNLRPLWASENLAKGAKLL